MHCTLGSAANASRIARMLEQSMGSGGCQGMLVSLPSQQSVSDVPPPPHKKDDRCKGCNSRTRVFAVRSRLLSSPFCLNTPSSKPPERGVRTSSLSEPSKSDESLCLPLLRPDLAHCTTHLRYQGDAITGSLHRRGTSCW